MVKHFCDRCGREVPKCEHDKYGNRRVEKKFSVVYEESLTLIDLCDDCSKELQDWMKGWRKE